MREVVGRLGLEPWDITRTGEWSRVRAQGQGVGRRDGGEQVLQDRSAVVER
ncbi:hypothetical protein ABZ897_31545 [Nonomuraea sp. NPDC046802]|uniref:hypothetical protein n=1 Tax=Nonomuraea sp. NPDC046802 TaxID=3154919 RepID=UPI0033F7A856